MAVAAVIAALTLGALLVVAGLIVWYRVSVWDDPLAARDRERCRGGAKGLFRDYRWAVIEGAGHWVHHDRPEAFLKVVRSFVLGENEAPA